MRGAEENKLKLRALSVAFEVLESLDGFQRSAVDRIAANSKDFEYNRVTSPENNLLFDDEFSESYMLLTWSELDILDRRLLLDKTKIRQSDGTQINAGWSWEQIDSRREFIRRLRICYRRALKIRSDCMAAGDELREQWRSERDIAA